jgi:putative endonuclease
MWSEYFDRVTDAIAMERKLKGWSRAKKRALIVDDWQSISRLSRRRGGKPYSQSVILRREREARASKDD